MNEKMIEKMGNLLLKAELIGDFDIVNLGLDYQWIKIVLYLNTNEIQSLSITFNKKYGYIMDMKFQQSIDFLEEN